MHQTAFKFKNKKVANNIKTMIELYIFIGAGIFGFLILFIKHIIELYIDNRRFLKEVNQMIEKNNKRFDDALKKGLEESIPLITDYILKQRALENER